MKVNISVKRTFKINGKEYHSIEEMPDDVREKFKKAIGTQAGVGHQFDFSIGRTKIVFNGMEYESMDAMPQEVRRLYEKILKASETGSSAPEINLADIGSLSGEVSITEGSTQDPVPKPSKFEPAFSPRMLLVIFMLGGLLLLIYYLWQSR